MENKNLSWTAPEFTTHAKNLRWYIIFFVVAALLIGYSLYTHDLLTVVTFAILAVVVFALSHQKPHTVTLTLTPSELRIGDDKVIPYHNLKKFWIIYTAENKTLNFETTNYLNNTMTIELGQQDPLAVKMFLKPYLPEDLNKEESLTDLISRKIKF